MHIIQFLLLNQGNEKSLVIIIIYSSRIICLLASHKMEPNYIPDLMKSGLTQILHPTVFVQNVNSVRLSFLSSKMLVVALFSSCFNLQNSLVVVNKKPTPICTIGMFYCGICIKFYKVANAQYYETDWFYCQTEVRNFISTK